MELKEEYLVIDNLNNKYVSQMSLTIGTPSHNGHFFYAKDSINAADAREDLPRAKRMARERLIKDIMTQLQEKLFGA